MAREYGYTPTEIMHVTGMAAGRRFHLDFDIMAATSDWISEQRERYQQNASSGRVASPQETDQMVESVETRADQREAMEQAGMKAPSPDGQISQLEAVLEERQGVQPDG